MPKEIDTKEKKVERIADALSEMREGESITPTALAKKIELNGKLMHPNTLTDALDIVDLLKDVGYRTIRGEDGKIRFIIKSKEDISVATKMRNMEKNIIDIKGDVEKVLSTMDIK